MQSKGYWVYSWWPEGSCFGPASERMVAEWNRRQSDHINYPYFGYVQKVVVDRLRPS